LHHSSLHSFPTRRSSDLAQFLFLGLAVFLQTADFGCQLFFERFNFVELCRGLRLGNFAFEKELLLRYSRLEGGIDLCKLFLLVRSEEHTSELQSPYDLVC